MKNEYKIIDNMVIIYLKKRTGEVFETIIDLDDLEKVKKLNFSWNAAWYKKIGGYYAAATEYLGMINGKPKYKTHLLHRMILSPNDKQCVDHKNHDTLDNRKENLRLSTKVTNSKNRSGKNKNNSTGYRNVSYDKTNDKYIVQLQIDKKNVTLGRFDDVHEAGKVAKEMRKKYYKDFRGKC